MIYGEKVLIPYLLSRRINKLDYIICSHFDTDHVGGIIKVVEELKVKNIIISKQIEKTENYKKLINVAKEKRVNIKIVSAGQRVNIEKNIYFDILWPCKESEVQDNWINNNSIVCKLNYNDFSMLFTGDIEKEAERAIISKYATTNILKSKILKVAHHGSKTSSTEEFLELIRPRYSINRSRQK